ncbi:MAG TPA: tetratricopeptide repeat protein, partial [Gemmataceae bacterium]|nr:tetratricopeptide repeat protein [Gemmataceae bacterium]
TDADYADAFRDAGIDLAKLEPAEAAEKIKAIPPSVGPGLTAALDNWAANRRAKGRNPERAAHLSRVAQLADPDPWRNDLRAALDQADKEARLKALQALAKTAKFDQLGPVSLHSLGAALHADGDSALAESVLRKGQQQHPRDVWVNSELGRAVGSLGRLDEAIRFLTAARAIRPESAHVLAHALVERGDFDEAIAVFCDLVALRPKSHEHLNCLGGPGPDTTPEGRVLAREAAANLEPAVAALREAIRLKPDDATSHRSLALTLMLQGKLDEAIAEFRTVKRLDPKDHFHWLRMRAYAGRYRGPMFGTADAEHTPDRMITKLTYQRANVLRDQGKLDDAITSYREVIRQSHEDPFRHYYPYAEAYCNLGSTLKRKGDYAGALEMYQKGHELSSRRHDWRYPSARWVAETERELALVPRLPAVLRGEDKPADNAERVAFAAMAYDRMHFVVATRLWTEALATDPGLANDLRTAYRCDAARAAVLASSSQGEDATKLDDQERTRLRQQALGWLRADLVLLTGQIESGLPADRDAAQQALRRWQEESNLAGIREATGLEQLPPADRSVCAKLWAEVAALRKTAVQKATQQREAGFFATEGQNLLARQKWAEAEAAIRKSLALREKVLPDDWTTFNAKSMLGGALLGQKQYADAEPLLLAGYEGMKQLEKSIPPGGNIRLGQAVERLAQLCEALDKKDETKKWRAEREKYPAEQPPAPGQTPSAADREIAAGRTQDALPHLVTQSAAQPNDTMLFLKLAALQAWFEQDKELAETCRRGLAAAQNTTVPET